MKTIYLLRHGTTGADGRFIGSTDLPLTASGVSQINELRPCLKQVNLDYIFCSPMLRCRETADHLGLSARMEIVDELREIDFGHWENKTYAEIEKEDSDLVMQWHHDPEAFKFPGGELNSGFAARVSNIYSKLVTHPAEKILVICHGGVIRHLICEFLRIDQRNSMLFAVQPGKLTIIDLFSEGGVLQGLNLGESCHG